MKTDTDLQNKKTLQTLTQKNTARSRDAIDDAANDPSLDFEARFPTKKENTRFRKQILELPKEICSPRDAVDDSANNTSWTLF